MTAKKPSTAEEEYIAKQESLVRHKAALEKARRMAQDERETRRREHFMKCPKCGMDLETIVYRGVAIDKCYHCNGTWLDAGELEQLAGHGGDILSRIVNVFRPGPGPIEPEPGQD
jgi:hypothetical protein